MTVSGMGSINGLNRGPLPDQTSGVDKSGDTKSRGGDISSVAPVLPTENVKFSNPALQRISTGQKPEEITAYDRMHHRHSRN